MSDDEHETSHHSEDEKKDSASERDGDSGSENDDQESDDDDGSDSDSGSSDDSDGEDDTKTSEPLHPVHNMHLIDTENPLGYRKGRLSPGALYPVHIGDELGGKYKVIMKLGNGLNSTVWLGKSDE
jgi:hypothetical protein